MSLRILLRDLMREGRTGPGEAGLNLRVYATGGRVTMEQLSMLAQILRRCGTGHIVLTSRQGIEVPSVPFDRIEEVMADLADVGLDSMYVSFVLERREPPDDEA